MMPAPQDWRDDLKFLIEQARREGKWLYAQNLLGTFWFTPDQLTAENANGKFVWGVLNWVLRDPHERLNEAMKDVRRCKRELDRAMKVVDELVSIITPSVIAPSLDQIMAMED